ncbi:hypothetical protein C8Q78DRAFT_1008759 [Trametes maxima]|nr:hypothetical protein C8Q78DRAFT_1008759 [Trametes maxima]
MCTIQAFTIRSYRPHVLVTSSIQASSLFPGRLSRLLAFKLSDSAPLLLVPGLPHDPCCSSESPSSPVSHAGPADVLYHAACCQMPSHPPGAHLPRIVLRTAPSNAHNRPENRVSPPPTGGQSRMKRKGEKGHLRAPSHLIKARLSRSPFDSFALYVFYASSCARQSRPLVQRCISASCSPLLETRLPTEPSLPLLLFACSPCARFLSSRLLARIQRAMMVSDRSDSDRHLQQQQHIRTSPLGPLSTSAAQQRPRVLE